jgi:hypothetical protein
MSDNPPLTLDHIFNIFNFDSNTGKFYWKNPPKYHPDLKGLEAGVPRDSTYKGKKRNKLYWVLKINGTAYKRGRLVFFVLNGRWPDPCIDHINGDSLDDRPCNLREVTVTQNAWNHKRRRKTNSLPMGVRSIGTKFAARISHNKKHHFLGVFDTPREAEEVYISKRKELYGEYSGY